MLIGNTRIGGIGSLSIKNTYDADALAYFERAGVTDATAKSQISAFVIGLKGLSLYNSIVSWPLRSTQNSGTGTTAYSLGGLGIYNATLSASPSWSTTGVSFSGAGTLVNDSLATLVRANNGYGAVLICSNSATGTVNFGVLKGGGGNQTGDNYIAFGRQYNFLAQSQIYLTGGTSDRGFGSLSFNASGFQFFGSSRTGLTAPATDTGYVKLNSSTNSTLSGSGNLPSTSPFGDNFYLFGQAATGNTYAFSMISTPMSTTNMESIRSLYKTTLGDSLGLP
jgi:hypothetical protein